MLDNNMYPSLPLPFDGVLVSTFGISLVLGLFAFYYMLSKQCTRLSININFFLGSSLAYCASILFFGRLWYVLLEWQELGPLVMHDWTLFFLTRDYHLSLVWALFGAIGVLVWKITRHAQHHEKYIDALAISFLFSAGIIFLGAFLGGQIYGSPTSLPIGIVYSANTAAPFTSPILPLAVLYALGSFLIFTGVYISKEFLRFSGAAGYVGWAVFSLMMFVGDFWNGTPDIVREYLPISGTQIFFLACLAWITFWFFKKVRPLH
jgi:prolipoprotein diacylglyceryltransferase